MVYFRLEHLFVKYVEPVARNVGPFDHGLFGGASSFAHGYQFPLLDHRVNCVAPHEVGISLRPLGDGLERNVIFLGVVEFVLDNAQESLIKLEQGLYFSLMLGVELFLLLDFFQVCFDRLLKQGVFLSQG